MLFFVCEIIQIQDDFKPVLRELLNTHPRLEFLQSTLEFQERYGKAFFYLFNSDSYKGHCCVSKKSVQHFKVLEIVSYDN